MSEKRERTERQSGVLQVIITLEQTKSGHKINVNHPNDVALSVNMICDALRILMLQNIKSPVETKTIIQPSQRDVHLVN